MLAASNARHLVDLLQARAAEQPDHIAYRLLVDGEEEQEVLTCGQLDLRPDAGGLA